MSPCDLPNALLILTVVAFVILFILAWVGYNIKYIIICCAIGFVLVICGGIIANNTDSHIETTYLRSVGDTSGISGSFTLGSGSVHSVPVITYYEKSGNGYKLGYTDAFDCIIHTDENENPYMIRHYHCCSTIPYFTEIHVPEDTITVQYTLNME